jgi:TolA-binding protein
MKGSERHRLKENEISQALGGSIDRLQENRSTISLVAGVVLLVLVLAGGYWAWTTRGENRAQMMLADAIVIVQSPVQEAKPGAKPAPGSYPTIQARAEAGLAKFTEAFNAYPSTQAGIAARYYAAGALAMLGRHTEAATRYQEVVDRAGVNSFYGRVAQLGVVDSNTQAKQYDRAITAAQALVNNTTDEAMPRDAVLMELGRVQAAAGKKAEAKQTLDKVIADFPDSPYIEEAKKILAELT